MITKNEKVFQADLAWTVLNNLEKFNDRPALVYTMKEKFDKVKDHTIYSMFIPLFTEAVAYHEIHGNFPDMDYLNKRLPEGRLIKITNEPFSMTMYEDLSMTLDYEYLIAKFNNTIGMSTRIDREQCLELSRDLANLASHNIEIPKMTKQKLIDSYEEYIKEYKGIKTGIRDLDEVIGDLPYRAVSCLAAPSGHGKTTLALTIAYNAAMQGYTVLYVSFEVTQLLLWFNLASIESSIELNENDRLVSSDIKSGILTDRQKELYQKYMTRMLEKIDQAHGWIEVMDQTTIQCETFEELTAKLESKAEDLGRTPDLIIVDNVDNLQVLKSSERDESTKVNQYIIALDKYSKTYCNGVGTHIMLLSQVNRTGMKKMSAMEGNSENVSVDVTCIQKFNALYEKASTVMVEYSSPAMRVHKMMKVLPVKLRNKPLPIKPVNLTVEFKYSKVSGGYADPTFSDDEITGASDGDFEIINDEMFGSLE